MNNDDADDNANIEEPNYDLGELGIGVLIGMLIALIAVYILMKIGFIVIENS